MFGARQPTDEEIIEKIRKGEQKMLLLLYKRNFDTLHHYIARNNGSRSDAEDVTQDALVVLWQQVQKPDFSLSARLDTYLYAIAKNIWLKQLRKQGRMQSYDFSGEHDMEIGETDIPQPQEEDDRVSILARYMNKLGESCRELLSLFYFEQWDMEKIAEKLGFANAQTAKAKKYQCKKKLEDLIKEHYKAEDLL